MEHLGVKEEQSIEGLVLSRSGHVAGDCQIAQKKLDFGFARCEVLPRAHLVKANLAANPVAVAALRADRVVFESQHFSDLVHELKFWVGDDRFRKDVFFGKCLVYWDLTMALFIHTLAYVKS